jgi:hypothetical protein
VQRADHRQTVTCSAQPLDALGELLAATTDDPWQLTTPPGTSAYTMQRDGDLLVCQVGGWYGQRNGYRGRFGMYLPPLLEALGLAELTHDARNNSMRGLAGEGAVVGSFRGTAG